MNNEITSIPTGRIRKSPVNPRKKISREELEELSQSIKAVGLLQPVTVRPVEEGVYEIVCGHRRYEAACMAGFAEIPCVVRELTDDESYEIMVTENLQRKDVDPFDESEAFGVLRSRGYDTASLADKFGKSQTYILSRMKLSELIPELRASYDAGDCDFSHCLLLARLDADFQRKIAPRYKTDDYTSLKNKSVKELRFVIKNLGKDLKTACFDTAECARCPKNQASDALFPEEAEAVCEDAQCFNDRTADFLLSQLKLAMERNPDFFIARNYQYDHASEPEASVIRRLPELGVTVKSAEVWRRPNIKRGYSLGDVTPSCFAFGGGWWYGEERKEDRAEEKPYKDDYMLDYMAKGWEGRKRDRIADIARENIKAMDGKALRDNAAINTDTVLKAALAYMVQAVGEEVCGLDPDAEDFAERLRGLDIMDVTDILAKCIALVAEADEAEWEYVRKLFPEQTDAPEQEAEAQLYKEAAKYWHGYEGLTDDMVCKDMQERIKRLSKAGGQE